MLTQNTTFKILYIWYYAVDQLNYFLHIAYEGTKYSGWQRQLKARSVQETIEQALKKIFNKDITVFGCGRTDAGVHASQYVLNIHIEDAFDFDLKFRLNKNIPDDIAVFDVLPMEEKQHARYDAIGRTYDYFIHLEKDPVLGRYSSLYEYPNLDLKSMQAAAKLLMKYNDFKAICKQPELYPNTRCTVTHAQLYVNEETKRLRFTITANRFLRGMVRLCIYFLLEIGTGKMSLEEFEATLKNKVMIQSMRPAFPNGLYLSRIEYPYLKLKPRESTICSLLKQGLED